MIAIIQFEMVMFWLGLRRPLGSEANDQIFVESDVELSRNDASIGRTLTKRVKDHPKWLEMGSTTNGDNTKRLFC